MQAIYNKLGHFEYGVDEEDIGEIKKWKGKYEDKQAIYIGEMKRGTENFHNFGILVSEQGTTIKLA